MYNIETRLKRLVDVHLNDVELGNYHARVGDEVERARIESHLSQCESCHSRYAEMEQILATDTRESVSERSFVLLHKQLNPTSSLFEIFLEWLQRPEPALATKTFDVEELRNFYNHHLIDIESCSTKVHVVIEDDNNHLILHFIGAENFNGKEVDIYRLDRDAGERPLMTCQIQGNDARFVLSQMGLTVRDLNQVAFRLKVGSESFGGRL